MGILEWSMAQEHFWIHNKNNAVHISVYLSKCNIDTYFGIKYINNSLRSKFSMGLIYGLAATLTYPTYNLDYWSVSKCHIKNNYSSYINICATEMFHNVIYNSKNICAKLSFVCKIAYILVINILWKIAIYIINYITSNMRASLDGQWPKKIFGYTISVMLYISLV